MPVCPIPSACVQAVQSSSDLEEVPNVCLSHSPPPLPAPLANRSTLLLFGVIRRPWPARSLALIYRPGAAARLKAISGLQPRARAGSLPGSGPRAQRAGTGTRTPAAPDNTPLSMGTPGRGSKRLMTRFNGPNKFEKAFP